MNQLKFNSTFSKEEIKNHFESADFFSGIMSGLEEALAFENGTAKAATIARNRTFSEIDSVKQHQSQYMVQKEFANVR